MDENRLKSWIVKIIPLEKAEKAKGTGFWAAEGGYILTCAHVIEGMNPPWIVYGEDKVPAEIIGYEGDIALLRVQGISGEIAPLGVEFQRGDTIDSLGYQYDRSQGLSYFPMKGTVFGQSELKRMKAITLEEAVHVKPGASGAPALNRRTCKVVGVISHTWEKHQNAFFLPLNAVFNKWEILKPRFHRVDYLPEKQERILDYYSTFVGREKEFKVVQDFLQNDEGGYLLIQGKAGMGKTALVAELARRGAQRKLSPHVCSLVFFIRQEGGQNTPEEFLNSLNLQLVQLLAERENEPNSLAEKKQQYKQLWKKLESQVSSQNRVLVLIDGLDESAQAGKQPLVEYLPPKLHPYVYWVITSRPLPDVLSDILETYFLCQAHSHWLAGLKLDEVRKLLRQFGDPVKRSDDFIKGIIKQTNGEPLFLRFLCQDIADWGEQAEAHLKQLEDMPKGVRDYFKWQVKLLEERMKGVDDRNLPLDILKILLVAYSGMTAHELTGVIGVNLPDIRDGLKSIERFLLGKEHYELMHLEFRRTVEEVLVREAEKEAVREKLLAYCAEYWQKDRPKERYALRYYLQHLWELKRYDKMLDLADNGYLEKKLGCFISPDLLEKDYQALFGACKELEDLKGLLRWGVHRARISDEAEAFKSIKNITETIGKLAQKGMKNWWERGIGICALIPGTDGKVEKFLELCQGLEPSKGEAPEEIFIRIRDLFLKIPYRASKDRLIVRYVMELCRWGIAHIDQALKVADEIEDKSSRSEAFAFVAQSYVQLPDVEQAASVLDQLLGNAAGMEDEYFRSKALVAVAQGYVKLSDVDQAANVLNQARKAAAGIEDKRYHSKALVAVAQGYVKLSDVDQAARVLDQAREAADGIRYEWLRVNGLVAVALCYVQLSDVGQAANVLDQALKVASGIEEDDWDEWSLPDALVVVAQGYVQLPDVEEAARGLDQVLKTAAGIEDKRYHSKALVAVAQGYVKLSDVDQAANVLNQARKAAAGIEDKRYHSKALVAVAQGYVKLLDVDQAARVLDQALEAAIGMEGHWSNPETLVAVARGYVELPDLDQAANVLDQALESAAGIVDEESRFNALASVAQCYVQLPDVEEAARVLDQVLESAAGLEDKSSRPERLVFVAQSYVQLADNKEVARGLAQVLESAVGIGGGWSSKVLVTVAQGYVQLPDVEAAARVLDQARKAAAGIEDERFRSNALVAVAQGYVQLPGVEKMPMRLVQANLFQQLWKFVGFCKRLLVSNSAQTTIFNTQHKALTWANRIGIIEKAVSVLDQALESAAGIECENSRSGALAFVVQGYVELPDVKQAAIGLNQVWGAANEIGDNRYRSKALVTVAQGYVQLLDADKAASVLDQALKAAAGIENGWFCSYALIAVAQGYVDLPDVDQATRALDRAFEAARIFDEKYRFEPLVAVAQAYVQLPDVDKAASVLDQALESAAGIEDKQYRSNALVAVAQGYVKLSDADQAANVLDQARKAAAGIKNEWSSAQALVTVAQSYVDLPDVDQAASVLGQALESVAQIVDEEYRSNALVAVAQGYEQLRDVEKAVSVLDQALESVVRIGDEQLCSEELVSVARGYGQVKAFQKVYDLLPSISNDQYFLATCKIIFTSAENLSEGKAGKFILDAIYHVLPLASQRRRFVYLQMVGEAVPFIVKYCQVDDVRSVLVFLEEQWNA